MKKIIMLFVSALCLAGCSESDLVESIIKPEKLSGEWVYDHPEEGVWETMKFTESGVFYYSNDVATWNINNDRNDGRYSVSGDHGEYLHGSYTENGQPMEVNMTFSVLNDYSFTATFAETGLTFTYSRLLTTQRLKQGETITPNYQSLVSAEINWYRSHDTSIATVDTYSGEITGVAVSGRTYIDVVTTKGTAVVEVLVSDPENLFDDYYWAFGLTVNEVEQQLGSKYLYKNEASGISYKSKNLAVDKETYMTSVIDDLHIEFVQLDLNSTVTSSQVLNLLNKTYRSLGKNEQGNDLFYEDSRGLLVIYDSSESKLSFAKQIAWPDFGGYFGLNSIEVRTRMETNGHSFFGSYESYSVNGSEGYILEAGNTYIGAVEFVFNTDNVVSVYLLYPQSRTTTKLINQHFTDMGLTKDSESGIYYNAKRTLSAVYDKRIGAIAVTDLTKKAFERNILGDYWRMLGKTQAQVKEDYGQPTVSASDHLTYSVVGANTEYAQYVNFIFNNNSSEVNLINLFLQTSVQESTIKYFLSKLYKTFDDGTNANGRYYRYINGQARESSSMMITYYPEYQVVVYQHPSTASAREVQSFGDR
ncbi:MAG: membrane lipoprotein lipid attachment site-containing protein [Prevotella sp.]|nr:membrane lipoprotein lipid attachment site-containing protein [Prevotella sp.]